MLGLVEAFFGFYKHVIDIGFHGVPQQRLEYLGHQPLVSCTGILQAKGHHIIAVQRVWGNEGRFLLVKRVHGYLMISREGNQKRQYYVPGCGVNNLNYMQ